MVSGRFRSVLKTLLIGLLGLLAIVTGVAIAGEYQGVEPGVSKKSDVEKLLGSPQREVIKEVKYDYNPPADDIHRVSVTFSKVGQVVERIDIYLRDAYTKEQFREWFEIKEPDKTELDAKGNLVEYYVSKGIILHFTDPDDAAPVEFFSHVECSSAKMNKIIGGALVERSPDTDKFPKDRHKVRPIVLLADDFDLENRSKGALNFSAFKNWDVLNGTVDIIGNGFWDFFPGRGLYLDLDGSTAQAGTLVSKTSFRLEPGKYKLQFDLAGSPLSGPNTVTVELGSAYRESFTLAMKASFETVVRDISVSSPGRAKLSFRNSGGDNQGLLLDNVKLMKIPDEL